MKRVRFSCVNLVFVSILFVCLSGCSKETGIEKVGNSMIPYEDGTIPVSEALANWSSCEAIGFSSFTLNNQEIVEYSCVQQNTERFINKVRENTPINPLLIVQPVSVVTKLQWAIGEIDIELLHAAHVWTFKDNDSDVVRIAEEDMTSDGVSMATSSSQLFDMSYFGSESRNIVVAEMFGSRIRSLDLQSFMKYKTRFARKDRLEEESIATIHPGRYIATECWQMDGYQPTIDTFVISKEAGSYYVVQDSLDCVPDDNGVYSPVRLPIDGQFTKKSSINLHSDNFSINRSGLGQYVYSTDGLSLYKYFNAENKVQAEKALKRIERENIKLEGSDIEKFASLKKMVSPEGMLIMTRVPGTDTTINSLFDQLQQSTEGEPSDASLTSNAREDIQSDADGVRGKVIEVLNSAGYTFVYVDKWMAAPVFSVTVGDTIIAKGEGMVMRDFTSKASGKTFDELYFYNEIKVVQN